MKPLGILILLAVGIGLVIYSFTDWERQKTDDEQKGWFV
jgi:hypothetical protein